MSNKKYIPLPGGKECKAKNPFDMDKFRIAYVDFEANSPTYALTEVMPEGETFEGKPVDQYQGEGFVYYTTDNISYYEAEGYRTRLAIKPLKAIEPVQEAPKDFDNGKAALCSAIANVLTDVVDNKETVEDLIDSGDLIALVKNAFEAHRDECSRNGVTIGDDDFQPFMAGYMQGYYENKN